MKKNDLKEYKFQNFNISNVNYFPKINIKNNYENKYYDRILEIDYNFMSALKVKKWKKFIKKFNSISDELIYLNDNEIVSKKYFNSVLKKLVFYGLSIQNRDLNFEKPKYILKKFKIDPKVLEKYTSQTQFMEESNNRILKVNLDYEIKTLINDQVKNLIEGHLNEKIYLPWGHIRLSSLKFEACICRVRNLNSFGNYHYDGDIYSFPIIIYLNKVDKKNGGFSYVQESLTSRVNYTLRAFHDYLDNEHASWMLSGDINKIKNNKNYKKFLKLPKVLQGSQCISFMLGEHKFKKYNLIEFNGDVGDAILFDGFHVIHEGGYPVDGDRFALFINYKFPKQKINRFIAKLLT